MKTIFKIIMLSMALAVSLSACQKELKNSQLGLYEEVYPVIDKYQKLKIDFINKENFILICTDSVYTTYVKYKYEIRGKKIKLTAMSVQTDPPNISYETALREGTLYFSWINEHKFEIGSLYGTLKTDNPNFYPNMIFKKE